MKTLLDRLQARIPDFFRRAAVSFSTRFAGLLIQFAGSIIIARHLGPEGFGAFTYAFIVATMIGMALSLGLAELSVRELPTYLVRKQHGHVLGFLMANLGLILATGLITAVLLYYLQERAILVLAPGWAMVTLMAVSHSAILSVSSALNGFQRVLTSQFIETMFRQGIYLAIVVVTLWLGYSFTPRSLFAVALIAVVPAFSLMMLILIRMFRAASAEDRPVKPQMEVRRWGVASLPLLVASFANLMQLDLDVLMVGAILTDYDVGLYRAAARGAAVVTIANWIGLQLVGPMLSRALADNKNDEVQKLLYQAATVSLMTGGSIILVLAFGAHFYLGLFGTEFTEATTSLYLLLGTQAFIVLAGPDALLLVMLHRERAVLILTVIGVVMNFVLNIVLINRMGMEGAALASLLSMAFVRIAMVGTVLRSTEFNPTLLARPLRG